MSSIEMPERSPGTRKPNGDLEGELAVVVEGLRKSFGSTRALDGVDLHIPTGSVLGLLGPNGAGKTTAVRVITTLLTPDAGRVLVGGYDVVAEPQAVRRLIGLSGQYAAVDENLTGLENLYLVGRLYGLRRKESPAPGPRADRTVRASGGCRPINHDLLRWHASPARPRRGARRASTGHRAR